MNKPKTLYKVAELIFTCSHSKHTHVHNNNVHSVCLMCIRIWGDGIP